MATYFKKQKDYIGQNLNEKWTDMTTNKNFVEAVSSIGGELEILSTYPTTDASKVGQKFIYKGNEWKYHSQAELDDLGWTTVSEGFPAPVSKIMNKDILFNTSSYVSVQTTGVKPTFTVNGTGSTTEIDFVGLGIDANKIYGIGISMVSGSVTAIKNGELLTSLRDPGTFTSISFTPTGPPYVISDTVLNDFFEQLPPTVSTVTIDIVDTTGAATCDTTIATSKGYTVIT
jgi:hypothetical protein